MIVLLECFHSSNCLKQVLLMPNYLNEWMHDEPHLVLVEDMLQHQVNSSIDKAC